MTSYPGFPPQPVPRLSAARKRFWLPGWLVVLATFACQAQPKAEPRPNAALPPKEAAEQGRALAAELLRLRPEENSSTTGILKIRDPGGSERDVPVKFDVILTATNWLSAYQTTNAGTAGGLKLTVAHCDASANRYQVQRGASPAIELKGNETMVPFADSDFWICDLGLEFLHWPEQTLLRKEMRRGQSCKVLQSVNPVPAAGAYRRVVSWIDVESSGIVHADAYDFQDKLLKQFDPKEFRKVNGQWQLEEMEIRSRQSRTRTRIEFQLGK